MTYEALSLIYTYLQGKAMQINYTLESLQEELNKAMHQYGYYYTAWNSTGSREDRESKAYYQGVSDTLKALFSKIDGAKYDVQASRDAYHNGEKAYEEEYSDDEDDEDN